MAEPSFQPFTGIGFRLGESRSFCEDAQLPSSQPSPDITTVLDSPDSGPTRPPAWPTAQPELCPVAGFDLAKERLEEWLTIASAWSLMDLDSQLQGQVDDFVMTATMLRSQFDQVDMGDSQDHHHMVPAKEMEQLELLNALMKRLSFFYRP